MFAQIIKDAVMITSFVMVMMLIIEYINVQSKGNWSKPLQKSSLLQLFIAAILGIIPGCLGTYAIVSLYTHNIVNFGAIVTVMIATSGDEAFVMFSMIPETSVKLTAIIFGIAILTGFIVNLLTRKKKFIFNTRLPKRSGGQADFHFTFHNEKQDCVCYEPKIIIKQLKNISFQRAILILSLSLFIFSIVLQATGYGNDHSNEWDWIKITFLTISIVALFIASTVTDHFLKEHLWEHIIKVHLLKIFLWTFGALLFIHFLMHYIELEEWVKTNQLTILIIAVLIGLIPESGPNIIFITLFFNGNIPFSILLANSIVQDGHGALPLLAESKKSFFAVKIINLLVGFVVGLLGFFLGW